MEDGSRQGMEINGDLRLSAADRLRYLWRNSWRNLRRGIGGPRTIAFTPSAADCMHLFSGQSPSRLLTERFFEALPQRLAPRPLLVVDIGCGTGSMAPRLEALGYTGRYIGVDVQDRFAHAPTDASASSPSPRLAPELVLTDAHQFTPPGPIELLVSVSALEHIPRDGELMQRLSTYMAADGLQVHAVPAGAALPAYLWHGYRQYTAADIAERFSGQRIEIYRIGGVACLLVHCVLIMPEIFLGRFVRAWWPGLYRGAVRAALGIDRVLAFWPTAYVIVSRR